MTAKFNCQSYQNGNFYSGGSTTKASCGTGKITTVCICRTDTMIMNTTPRVSSVSTQQWAKYFGTFIMVIQTLWMIKTCNTCSFIPVNFYSNTFVVTKETNSSSSHTTNRQLECSLILPCSDSFCNQNLRFAAIWLPNY